MELRFDHQFAAAPEQVYAQISDLPAAAKFAQDRGMNLTVLGPRGPWAVVFRLGGQAHQVGAELGEDIPNESLGFDFTAPLMRGTFDVVIEPTSAGSRASFFVKAQHQGIAGRVLFQGLRLMGPKLHRLYTGQLRPYCRFIETRLAAAD